MTEAKAMEVEARHSDMLEEMVVVEFLPRPESLVVVMVAGGQSEPSMVTSAM